MAAGNLVQGALFTVMVVRAGMLRDPAFAHELAQQVERSPRFFQNAPVVLDLKGADGFHLGDRNIAEAQGAAARAHAGPGRRAERRAGPARRRRCRRARELRPERDPAEPPPGARRSAPRLRSRRRRRSRAAPETPRTRRGWSRSRCAPAPRSTPAAPISSSPRRSAPGPSWWPTATSMSTDALRGRALAGASGDAERANLLLRLEAELVSIAGRYLVSEQLPAGTAGFAGADRARR